MCFPSQRGSHHRSISALLLAFLAGCGDMHHAALDAPHRVDAVLDSSAVDAAPDSSRVAAPVTPVAPTASMAMYQGTQRLFTTQLGTTCPGRVAASMGGTGFCFLASDDTVRCAGVIGSVDYGMQLASIGQTGVEQIMVMFLDQGMCVTRTDHTVQCMGTNTNAFGSGNISTTFSQWTSHTDVAAIATGTWDQICGIDSSGQVFCGGISNPNFGYPPVNVGSAGQTSVWVDTFGEAHLSDPNVLRPAESRTDCQVSAGLECLMGGPFGPVDGTLVMGTELGGNPSNSEACWLTSNGTVTCSFGPRFAPGRVLFFAADSYSDSLCAIYNDGSVWCIGSNDDGKLGTGNTNTLTTETMVAPPGSARVACDL
jgi:hypothetical protein